MSGNAGIALLVGFMVLCLGISQLPNTRWWHDRNFRERHYQGQGVLPMNSCRHCFSDWYRDRFAIPDKGLVDARAPWGYWSTISRTETRPDDLAAVYGERGEKMVNRMMPLPMAYGEPKLPTPPEGFATPRQSYMDDTDLIPKTGTLTSFPPVEDVGWCIGQADCAHDEHHRDCPSYKYEEPDIRRAPLDEETTAWDDNEQPHQITASGRHRIVE